MKKGFFLILATLALVSCQTGTTPAADDPATPDATTPAATTPATTSTRYVKNSKWVTVKTVEVTTSRAAVTEDELTSEVIDYNVATTGDQYTILTTDVAITESPTIDVYIVNPTTHEKIHQYLGWPRTDYVDRYSVFVEQAQADGGVLYVDQIPPAPEPVVDTRTDYEKYALYLIASTGAIIYEEHCADTDWATGGWTSLKAYYIDRKCNFELQARGDGKGEYVKAGEIYTAPAT